MSQQLILIKMYSLYNVFTITEHPLYIFCIHSTRKMWITMVDGVVSSISSLAWRHTESLK